jgi:hypothetical protein
MTATALFCFKLIDWAVRVKKAESIEDFGFGCGQRHRKALNYQIAKFAAVGVRVSVEK